jgi:tryptophanyl-tRNA synthetase
MDRIDPWTTKQIDISRIFQEFGVERIDPLLDKIPIKHRFVRRRIILGHRDYDKVLNAINKNEKFAVMSGFMPSGAAHIGHKMVMEEIIWHQKMGGDVFVSIADMEAHAVRGIPLKKCREIGIREYITSIVALGLNPENAHIYFQSENFRLRDLMFEIGIVTNFSTMSAIYGFSGDTAISHISSVLAQSADILLPQLKEFGGARPVVVPVGFDQDPHIRLVRDVADKLRRFQVELHDGYVRIRNKTADNDLFNEVYERVREYEKVKIYQGHIDILDLKDATGLNEIEEIVRKVEMDNGYYGFYPPSSIYHLFVSGLTGGKMSSSNPDSHISLLDKPEYAAKKVKKAKTGGRVSLDEQREKGGDPDNCSVFELLYFHLIEDDIKIERIREECRSGERVCGECKKEAAVLIEEFLKDHQEKRKAVEDTVESYIKRFR